MEKLYNNLNKKLDNLQATNLKHHKHENRNQQHIFYQRTVNLMNITFTTEEQKLLDQGTQYGIPQPTETQWTTLVLKTEQAIKLLDPKIQDAYRFMTAKKHTQIRTQQQQDTQTTVIHRKKHTQQTQQEQSYNHTSRQRENNGYHTRT